MKILEFHQRRDLINEIGMFLQLGDFTSETQRAIGSLNGRAWDMLTSHPAMVEEAQEDTNNINISERTIHKAISDIKRRMQR